MLKVKEFKIRDKIALCYYEEKEEKSFNTIYDEIIINDCYRIINKNFGEADFVFDIGANIGLFSLVASTIYNNACVVSIEPNEELIESLRKNSPCSLKLLIPFGNPIEKRKIKLDDMGNIYTKTVIDNKTGKPCIGLNGLVGICGAKNYIVKIDCQGAEHVLFNEENLKNYHLDAINNAKYLAIEIHDKRQAEVHEFSKKFTNHHCEYLNNILYMTRKDILNENN
jgi:FkbM family methyltransferase